MLPGEFVIRLSDESDGRSELQLIGDLLSEGMLFHLHALLGIHGLLLQLINPLRIGLIGFEKFTDEFLGSVKLVKLNLLLPLALVQLPLEL